MKFENLKIKEIDLFVRYKPDKAVFSGVNRMNHIVGIQLSGEAEHSFRPPCQKKFTLKKGSLYFFNQAEDYDVCVRQFGQSVSVHFTTYEPIETESFCANTTSIEEAVRFLTFFEKEYLRKNELRAMTYFYEFCALTEKLRKNRYSPQDKRMKSAGEYIRANFAESNCLEAASNCVGLSRRRFNDLFSAYYHTTPNRFKINVQIEYARRLLMTDGIGIAQIAELCGFSDIYYFAKLFKKETGFSPSEYRKQTRLQ